MIYMKVNESVKGVSFEFLPENACEYYKAMYYHSNPSSRFYDVFMYELVKHINKNPDEFKCSSAVELMKEFAKKYDWYFVLTNDERICVPFNPHYNGDPNGILKKYKYDFDENSVTVTRIK